MHLPAESKLKVYFPLFNSILFNSNLYFLYILSNLTRMVDAVKLKKDVKIMNLNMGTKL
jgi:hypothetical protein